MVDRDAAVSVSDMWLVGWLAVVVPWLVLR